MSGAAHILLAQAFFAFMNVGVKLVPRVPAHEIVFFRAATTLVTGYIILRVRRVPAWGVNRPLLVARGLVGTAALLMYFWSLQHMPLATAVTVQHVSPIFTVLVSALLLRELPRPIQLPFFLMAFAGVALVKGFDPAVTLVELGVGIGAAVLSAVAYNLIRMLREHDHPLVVVFYFPLVTVPVVGPYTLTRWHPPSPLEWGVLIAVGLATTAAQIFITRAYQQDRAANISIFNYTGIVFALALGLVLFHEVPDPFALAGVLLIALGVALGTRYSGRHDA